MLFYFIQEITRNCLARSGYCFKILPRQRSSRCSFCCSGKKVSFVILVSKIMIHAVNQIMSGTVQGLTFSIVNESYFSLTNPRKSNFQKHVVFQRRKCLCSGNIQASKADISGEILNERKKQALTSLDKPRQLAGFIPIAWHCFN